MVRTQIQLTEEQASTIRKIARKRHVSMAEVIRQSIDTLVKVGTADEERRMRALEAAGKFHSGVSDLAAEHDKYLAEAFRK